MTSPAGSIHEDRTFAEKRKLGRTDLSVGRIGVGSSYDAPARAYEEAFERGLNYFYWGSRRRDSMSEAIISIAPRNREALVVVVQTFARLGMLAKTSCERALKALKLDYADVLLLGWFNSEPPARIIDAALELKQRGRVRFIAISSHHRPLFSTLLDDGRYDIWHARYNAVHRGAEREIFPALRARQRAERPGMVTYTTTRWGQLCDPRRTPPGERTPTGADCHRFVLSQPEVDMSICGPSTVEQMRDVLTALDRGPMDEEELGWMRRVGDHIYGKDPARAVRDGS